MLLIAGKILEEDEDFHYLYAIGIKKTLSSAFAVGLELDGGFQREEGVQLDSRSLWSHRARS